MTDFTTADFMVAMLLAAIAAYGILHSRAQMTRKRF